MTSAGHEGYPDASYTISEEAVKRAVVGSPTSAKSGPHRLTFIEGMRALCALYVVLGHIGNIVDPSRALLKPSHAPLWMQQLLRPFQEGHLAVASFIVISGFCLAHAALERNDPRIANLASFFSRRALRILPAYYACLFISTWVALNVTPVPILLHQATMPFAQYIPVTRDNFLAHLFMVHNFRPEWMYKINGVLWSIAIEFQLYFLFPSIMRGLKRTGWLTILLVAVTIAILIVNFVPHGIKFYSWYLPLFVWGALGAFWARRKYLRPEFLLICAAGMAYGIYIASQRGPLWQSDSAFAMGVLGLLVVGSHRTQTRNPLIKALGWKPLALVGSFSYSLYLMHHPVLQTAFIMRPRTVHSQTAQLGYLALVGLPASIFVAFLFGLVCEHRWVLAALQRFRKPRAVGPSEPKTGF